MLNGLLSLHLYLYRTPQLTNPDITVLYTDIDKHRGSCAISYSGRAHSSVHSIKGGSTKHPVIDNLYSALDDYLVYLISGARPGSSIRVPLVRLCLSSFKT